ncbi:Protein of unknown function (DUF2975) [Isoptericola sp. CG 20/1183]|uniref:DUF2975 domain-containing protein n=2 Tax=Isoptericola halotolerans TaxID=300560 RepID=A0ABX5EIE3_9MICO|nr:DUF2975 domain-containing protein [Isoptericola sp. CG 20/1183]PRZ09389.1 Protein of unknown function (DUF2975) [Isoptericola sp. CG 20/1183]PRZ10190.1 Protein of unknown function (DUF2975) [Isoptericola halotolerans]
MARARRAFKIGGWVALAAAVVTAALAVAAAVIGAMALTGKVTYPADYSLGPLYFQDTLSVQVTTASPVCQEFDITELLPNEYPGDGSFCYKLVQDGGEQLIRDDVVYQDPSLRPTEAVLTGEVRLATTGGWNPWVAAQVVKQVIIGTVITVWLLLLWRLLAAAAAGNAFSARTVQYLRAMGWLTIASAALAPALDHFTGLHQVQALHFAGYGPPFLDPVGTQGYPDGVDLVQVALGGLVLLVAEVFRHGAAIEDERRLTV